jgi:putative transposase
VSRSGYYSHILSSENIPTADEKLIINLFEKKKRKFGIRRLKMELARKSDVIMNLKKIRRIKSKFNLVTEVRKKNRMRMVFKAGEEHKVAPNLVQRKFSPVESITVLSTDVTELKYEQGQKAYLSAFKDLRTKEIVNFSVSPTPSLNLVIEGLPKLLSSLQKRSVVIHSDQGVQYTSGAFRSILQSYGVKQSMSRKGNCLDNSPIESFFGHLKDEVDLKRCKNFKEVSKEIEKYMNYYNNDRPQWNLKQKTPAEARVKL